MGRPLQLCVAALLSAWPAVTLAEAPRELKLAVVSPADVDCVTTEELRARVQERVGSAVLSSAPRAIDVQIVHQGRGFRAAIRADDAEGRRLGERSLHADGPGCDALERPLVLVISTMVGMARDEPVPDAAARKKDDERLEGPARKPSEEPEPDAGPSPLPAPRSPASPTEPIHLGVAVSGGIQSGLFPGVSPLLSVRLVARHRWLALRVGAAGTPWAERDLGGHAGATFRGLFGDVDLCASTSASPSTEFAFCGGARAGAIHARTTGLYEDVTTVRPFVEMTLGTIFQVALARHHAVLLELGGTLPLLPQRFVFVEADGETRPIHAINVGVSAEMGWLWRFGS